MDLYNILCDACDNRVHAITTPSELYFKCQSCGQSKPSRPDDSLRFEESKMQISADIGHSQDIHLDAANPKKQVFCKKCGVIRWARYVVSGSDLITSYGCMTCGDRFVES